jgi:hypothetical protein
MTLDENACIRYLMGEMDPAEVAIFKRELTEDQDLLIEYQSLKATCQHIGNLPEIEPGTHVAENILQLAALQCRKRERKARRKPLYYAAAATICIGMMSGMLLIYLENNSANSDVNTAGMGSMNQEIPANTHILTSPWIDNNEILRFQDMQGVSATSSIDSLYQNSYQKLIPVSGNSAIRLQNRDLQLTGSRP